MGIRVWFFGGIGRKFIMIGIERFKKVEMVLKLDGNFGFDLVRICEFY